MTAPTVSSGGGEGAHYVSSGGTASGGIGGSVVGGLSQGVGLAKQTNSLIGGLNNSTANTAASGNGMVAADGSTVPGNSGFAGGLPSSDPSQAAGTMSTTGDDVEDGSANVAEGGTGATFGGIMAVASGAETVLEQERQSRWGGMMQGALGGAEAGAAMGTMIMPGVGTVMGWQ